MISYKVKLEDHPLYGLIELKPDQNGMVDVLCNNIKGINILEESTYDTHDISENSYLLYNNPNGYYHPREIVHLFTDDEIKLSKLFTMKEWLEYYTDVCNNNIFPIKEIEDERQRIVSELYKKNDIIAKEQIIMFGYNPELEFNLNSITKQSLRLNNIINQKDEYEFIDEASQAEWSLTLRNFHLMLANFMKSASQTGNFKGLRKNLLKMVKSCKSKEELDFLRKDRNKAKPYLNKLADNKPKFKEKIDEHIKWLDGEYSDAIDNKSKELKSIKESYIEESTKNKTPIYIVLSRTYSRTSNLIHKVTGDEYTHSSISFDLVLDKMYTFNKKGFYIDTLKEFKTFGNIPMAIYGIYVDNHLALKIKMKLNEFLSRKDKFHYSQIGLLGVIMNKPIVFDNRKFCSEFVDELLKIGNIDITGKVSSLVRPQEFKNTKLVFKVFEGKVNDYNKNKAERIVKYVKEEYVYEATLPIEFDNDGNLIVKNISKLDYQKEWEKSHKLLLGYETTNNIEGMKYEVAKLWYLNTKLEGLLYNINTKPDDRKKYTDIRARILNDFNKYFKIITQDKSFNFTKYYEDTPFSTDSLKISKSTIFHTINIAKQFIRP